MVFSVRVVLALAAAFVATFVASKIMIPILARKKAGQNVRDDGPQTHLVKQGTPTMGGIMIVMGVLVAALCFSIYSGSSGLTVVFLVGTMLLFMLIGFWDDVVKLFQKRSLGLRAWQKIVLQLVVAAAVALFLYFVLGSREEKIPLTNSIWEIGWGKIPLTMFIFIAMVNSVNLTDGLDGLATSLTLVNTLTYLAIIFVEYPLLVAGSSAMLHNTDVANVAVFAAAVSGACAAFLFFNKYPAKVFMGDTGSFALGAAIAAIAASLDHQCMLLFTGIMFVLSSVSVIIQVGSFKLRGKRVFKMAPLHHHFELMGAPETKVVAGYVIITVLLCVMCVISVGLA